MANRSLFRTLFASLTRPADAELPVADAADAADAVNEAGGEAYQLSPAHALAQLAATGCLNATYYADAAEQLDQALALAHAVDVDLVAKTAVYARERAAMKDLPALLLAVLAVRSPPLLRAAFPRVIDSPKMLRTFVQILRSGRAGRRSLGTVPKALVRDWLAAQSETRLFHGSVGNHPSLADVIKMVHPAPATPTRAALYGYLLGRPHDASALPPAIADFERLKARLRNGRGLGKRKVGAIPTGLPFQMLTALELGRDGWVTIARDASWQTTRMLLETFVRHGVFEVNGMTGLVAARLRNPEAVRAARALPYQLLVTYRHATSAPALVRDALHDALEVAIENVPTIDGKVYVLPDVSGSMAAPITGRRGSATTAVRCLDVAALAAAAILRRNPTAEVVPFQTTVLPVRLEPRDSVLTNAERLAALPQGGTNCSAPLAWLNARRAKGDLVVYLSDNESWLDSPTRPGLCLPRPNATATLREWAIFKARNPQAKLVCIDLQPTTTTPAAERKDVINIGGFSDDVFRLLADIATGEATSWLAEIERVDLTAA
jgi:60 kDa SS-A/Ro ribonucleoprotein